ncbi:DUF5808 domain-containing protein [Oscillospiraceae bacterium WX1]
MIFQLIMLFCFIPVPIILYFVMRNEAKPKKNLILGVTLPHDVRELDAVKNVVAAFLRQQTLVFIPLVLLLIPALFFQPISVVMMWYFLWLIIALVAPFLPYGLANKKLKTLKRQNGWISVSAGVTLVDTKLAVTPPKMLSIWVFLPAILISLIPVVLTVATLQGRDEFWVMLTVYASLFVMVAAFYFIYRLIFRQKAEVIDENTALTAALTQVRRYNWAKSWVWTVWLSSFFSLALWFFSSRADLILVLSLLYSGILLFVLLRAEFKTREMQQKLSEDSGGTIYTDEDDYWFYGSFYSNPHDEHVLVNRRTGIGTTVNLARTPGKIMMGFVVLILLSMPLLGLWMMQEEFTPVTLLMTEQQLVARHTHDVYKIDVGSVQTVSLIESLPDGIRTNGTAMSSVLKGNFRFDGLGDCRVCLDPRTPPFLVLTTDARTYILGSHDSAATRALYQVLAGKTALASMPPS